MKATECHARFWMSGTAGKAEGMDRRLRQGFRIHSFPDFEGEGVDESATQSFRKNFSTSFLWVWNFKIMKKKEGGISFMTGVNTWPVCWALPFQRRSFLCLSLKPQFPSCWRSKMNNITLTSQFLYSQSSLIVTTAVWICSHTTLTSAPGTPQQLLCYCSIPLLLMMIQLDPNPQNQRTRPVL